MAIVDSSPQSGGFNRKTAVERLIDVIGYPERVSAGALSYVLRVDGSEISCEETGGRIILSMRLGADEARLPALAGYAAGRLLKEDAVLAWRGDGAFLWQDASSDASGHELLRLFETFANSCDWWRERVSSERDAEAMPQGAMVILP